MHLNNNKEKISVVERIIEICYECVPPKTISCDLILNVMVFGGGNLERLLGHEDRTHMNGILLL